MSSIVAISCRRGHVLFDKINGPFRENSAVRCFGVSAGKRMRFVQFRLKEGGPQHVGAQIAQDGDVFDISAVDSTIPNSMVKFIAAAAEHSSVMENAKRIIAAGKSVVPLSDITFLPPLTKMDKVACVGLNYLGHCKEQNLAVPKEPMIFSKFPSVVIGPHDDIHLPKISSSVDWEVELAVVIGKKAKSITQSEADNYIFGYTVAQDISARDWQKKRNNGQFLLGKSMDDFCPMGPCIVTKDSIDAENLDLKTWVNGTLKQNGNSSDLVFKINFLVAYLSEIVTLYPGDVILTGTPSGVGMHRIPPEYLKSGDLLESEIEGIGKLRNKCV